MRLLKGDTLELMATLPDGCADMILCDLPYGTTACKWDTVIPFEPLWGQYKRLIKKNGAIVLTAGQPFTSKLISSNIEAFKYCWIWEKSKVTGVLNAKHQPLRNYEDVCVFASGGKTTYNPQGTEACEKVCLDKWKSENYGKKKHEPYTQTTTGYPRQVLRVGSEGATVHPTQKPVALCEYLIRTYTNEGETVLDNTMGSGTTGVACVNTGRDFIGIERDDKYFEIAQNRIIEAMGLA
jgi:site-specific DNA-methyltransferase (adenine-specific)